MTVLEPTGERALRLAREKAGDFEWAFNRLVEIMVEETEGMPPTAKEVVRLLLERSFRRLHEDNQVRRAAANRAANEAP